MAVALEQTIVEQSVNSGASISAEVDTISAEHVYVFVDDGTSAGNPSSYDFAAEYQTTGSSGSYTEWVDVNGKTTHESYQHPAIPYTYRATVVNQAASAQNIRLRVVAVKYD